LFVGVKKLALSLTQFNKKLNIYLFDTRKSLSITSNKNLNYKKNNYSVNFIYYILGQFKLNITLFKLFTLTKNYSNAQLVEVKKSEIEKTEIQKASQRLNTKDIQNLSSFSNNLETKKEIYKILANKDEQLYPFYVTGFAEAESNFSLKITQRGFNKTGFFIHHIFKIELHNIDTLLLKRIKTFFQVGNYRENILRNTVIYSVESVKDITNFIIPHFKKYPLLNKKHADSEILVKIVEMMNHKEHLNDEGLQQNVNLKAAMN
jgi:LAGLIDADG endonuclease